MNGRAPDRDARVAGPPGHTSQLELDQAEVVEAPASLAFLRPATREAGATGPR